MFLKFIQQISTINIELKMGTSNDSDSFIKGLRQLFKIYFDNSHSSDTFASEFLTYFGLLKVISFSPI
jgi:hypothetical protein